jgi:hypothetical protein
MGSSPGSGPGPAEVVEAVGSGGWEEVRCFGSGPLLSPLSFILSNFIGKSSVHLLVQHLVLE